MRKCVTKKAKSKVEYDEAMKVFGLGSPVRKSPKKERK